MSIQENYTETEKRKVLRAEKLRIALATMQPDSRVRRGLLPSVGIFDSDQTLWRHIRDGKFPSPVEVRSRTRFWRYGDLQAYLNGCRSGWPVDPEVAAAGRECAAKGRAAMVHRRCGIKD